MKLIIHKFKRHEDLIVPIPCQLRAGNEKGKTTILEAFSFVLTGKDLSGNEFKQVYDNRIDLHEAIADVEFTDNYGNKFRRVVKPQYSISRDGIERLKTKCSTHCFKNTIECNDFSDEFNDFLKIGTDYFFNQKAKSIGELEQLQRSMFIDLLKHKMPDYDVKTASAKKKELEKAQRNGKASVEYKLEQLKGVKDVEVDMIDPEIEVLNNEYLSMSAVDNSALVAEINRKNNTASDNFFATKRTLSNQIQEKENLINSENAKILTANERLDVVKKSEFVPVPENDTEGAEKLVGDLKSELEKLTFFDKIEDYAAIYFNLNPVLVENAEKIKEIQQLEFVPSDEISSACPLSGEVCETAKLHSQHSFRMRFDAINADKISTLKAQNRSILQKEMNEINSKYLSVKSDLERAEKGLESLISKNAKIKADNEFLRDSFDGSKKSEISRLNQLVSDLKDRIDKLVISSDKLKNDLANLTEPTPERLPETIEISEQLKQAHADFELQNKEITKQIGVNENNVRLREQYNSEIKQLQGNLFTIGEEISKLTAEISDYFSNLEGIVKSEFSGKIKIGVELLEYVMSRDEYKDCFKITANGKVFPYECNGALQNNLKLQVLATFQRLKGYTGITLMDNCEANTTQPVETCGLNCVLAYATNDENLSII